MKLIKKFVAFLTCIALAFAMCSCVNIQNTRYALVVDGEEVPAGVFIYYTIAAYYEVAQIVNEHGDNMYDPKSIKDCKVDEKSSLEWIQDKAIEFCTNFVAINKEFDKLELSLSNEDIEKIDSQANQAYEKNYDTFYNNGIGIESVKAISTADTKRQRIFDYHFGIDGDKGYTEEQYQQHFVDSYARVKYLPIEYKDADGGTLKGAAKDKVVEMAKDYVDRVNAKSAANGAIERLYEMNSVIEDYAAYLEEQKLLLVDDEGQTATTPVTTTTTTATEDPAAETTTTTTDKYLNERLIAVVTTVATTANVSLAGDEPSVPEEDNTPDYSPSKKSYEFIFNEAPIGKAAYCDDEENSTCYVILRADLRERFNEDDLWNIDIIRMFQNELFSKDFEALMKAITDTYPVEKNKASLKRYSPFKLTIKIEEPTEDPYAQYYN